MSATITASIGLNGSVTTLECYPRRTKDISVRLPDERDHFASSDRHAEEVLARRDRAVVVRREGACRVVRVIEVDEQPVAVQPHGHVAPDLVRTATGRCVAEVHVHVAGYEAGLEHSQYRQPAGHPADDQTRPAAELPGPLARGRRRERLTRAVGLELAV